MPFVPPRPTLKMVSDATIEETRKAMFEAWIDECVGIQEAFIEGLLSVLPSLVVDGRAP